MPDNPDEWTTADAIALRTYIAANPKFLRVLAKRRPKIEGDTMEARAVTGSDANGFFTALDEIDGMQKDPPQNIDNPNFVKT